MLLVHGKAVRAQDDRPDKEHLLAFLNDKMPESFELFQKLTAGESEILERAAELMTKYREIAREAGLKEADAFLSEERSHVRLEILVGVWRETEDEAEQDGFKKEIAAIIGAQIDRELADGQSDLESLEEEVEQLSDELEDIRENRGSIIAEELAAILDDEDGPEDERGKAAGRSQEFSITQSWSQEKNYKRPYFIHVPEAASRERLPVIILLHGNGGNAKGVRNLFLHRYPTLASQYIGVFPEGYRESWNIVSERSKADDRGFLEAIILELAKRDDVETDRFTIMGISNGAALANQIAIETKLPNIKNYITSVSPLNGYQHDGKNFKAMGEDNNYRKVAKPLTGKRFLNVSGTDDRLVPYRGGPSNAIPAKDGKLPFVDAEESILLWAKTMGYEGQRLPKPSKVSGKIEIFSYLDGDVVHFKVNDHGHNATAALSERLLVEFLREE